MRTKRIGIYSGTFDPVHAGHIAFALQAMQAAKLDRVYFLSERRPRHKIGVEHFAHRVAMLKVATRPHSKLDVLETDDVSFTIKRTLPHLQRRFKGKQLVFITGSDVTEHLAEWPLSHRLLQSSELVVGLRGSHTQTDVESIALSWPQSAKQLHIIDSYAPHVSSRAIREALRARKYTAGLLRSVAQYSNRHWLYISLA